MRQNRQTAPGRSRHGHCVGAFFPAFRNDFDRRCRQRRCHCATHDIIPVVVKRDERRAVVSRGCDEEFSIGHCVASDRGHFDMAGQRAVRSSGQRCQPGGAARATEQSLALRVAQRPLVVLVAGPAVELLWRTPVGDVPSRPTFSGLADDVSQSSRLRKAACGTSPTAAILVRRGDGGGKRTVEHLLF